MLSISGNLSGKDSLQSWKISERSVNSEHLTSVTPVVLSGNLSGKASLQSFPMSEWSSGELQSGIEHISSSVNCPSLSK